LIVGDLLVMRDGQWRIYNVRKEGAQGVWGMEVPQWGPGAKPR